MKVTIDTADSGLNESHIREALADAGIIVSVSPYTSEASNEPHKENQEGGRDSEAAGEDYRDAPELDAGATHTDDGVSYDTQRYGRLLKTKFFREDIAG